MLKHTHKNKKKLNSRLAIWELKLVWKNIENKGLKSSTGKIISLLNRESQIEKLQVTLNLKPKN